MIKEINSIDFEEAVSTNKLTIVKFGAPWCAACQAIHPALEALASNNKDINFIEIDADKNTDFVVGLGIRSLPTFGFYKNGQQLSIEKGLNGKDITQRIAEYN